MRRLSPNALTKDFTGADLRGRSFRDRDLAGSVLRDADLRGARFDGADLHGADLRGARTGMSRRWEALVVGTSLLLSIGCGVAAGYAGRTIARLIGSSDPRLESAGSFVALALVVFLIVAVVGGLRLAARRILPVLAAIAGAVAVAAPSSKVGTGELALAAVALILAMVAVVVLASLARTLAGSAGVAMFVVVALSGGLTGALLHRGRVAAAVAIAALLVGKRALRGHASAFPLLCRITARVACRGGTSFRDANLSAARLGGARLDSCDFRGAALGGAELGPTTPRLCLFDPTFFEGQRSRRAQRQRA